MIYTNENSSLQSLFDTSSLTTEEIKKDFYIACLSREMSIIARKEVLSGRASFGIFGDGKEVAQIALAKNFQNGDWRSGYYRDQTFMLATGMTNPEEFFAMLYGNTDLKENSSNGGRNFNNHFGTRYISENGEWLATVNTKNSASDISPTAGQIPRLLGLAYASKIYRYQKNIENADKFSNYGNEVAFGTIGDASTSEGHFWEVVNAAAVLKVPMVLTIWDDGYGISVPTHLQTVKGNIYEALKGFVKQGNSNGIYLYQVKGWDYPSMIQVFKEGVSKARIEHVPVIFHVNQLTQPLGHSTSGSHERYKSKERLEWEKSYDPLVKMKQWMIEQQMITELEANQIQNRALHDAYAFRNQSYHKFISPILKERDELLEILENKTCRCSEQNEDKIKQWVDALKNQQNITHRDVVSLARKILRSFCVDCNKSFEVRPIVELWLKKKLIQQYRSYSTNLYCENNKSALNIPEIRPIYLSQPQMVHGREILRKNFDALFSKYSNLIAIGEDIGYIGGVNQTYEGLQHKYGELRITDTSIREASIIGQGIGMAMRGLRIIAEIQYLDYLLYALQTLSDDLATLRWRTNGGQAAPLIVSTRGHRLVGIWHSGSPMGLIINGLRGIYICVPRNMTQAAGFYNTLLRSQDPAIVIEPLNGYRVREPIPENIGEFTVPLGIPEIISEGTDITVVTYGSMVHIVLEAGEILKQFNINIEVIDIRTLLPFDVNQIIKISLKKTRRLLIIDEDVPGGASAYILQQILEVQKGWEYLLQSPITLTAKEHRPAYASDGDYFSKPNVEDIVEKVLQQF